MNMNYKDAFKILEIEQNNINYNDISLEYLKKKYHKLALQNHLTFPSFAMLSEYDDPSTLYYDLESTIGFPIRHW